MKRLLIVDDEHHIVNWLASLFESQQQLDLGIYTAYNGKDALQILRNIKIDIVLLDIKMPGMDGLVSENILADWPGCRITDYMDAQTIDIKFFNNWNTRLNEMSLCLNRGEHRQFTNILKQLKFSCKKIDSMHHLPMIGIYQKISSLLISYINKYHLVESIAPQIGLYPLYFIHDFENWQAAFEYLEKLTGIIFALDNDSQLDSNQKIVLSIKDYIHNHLSCNLTLTALSDVVNYNSAYVSRVFKQVTGMNLSGYITTCRINKAKDLLQTTNESISAIAQKVGFDTSQYFSMVFQKEVGLTPSEFRGLSKADHPL